MSAQEHGRYAQDAGAYLLGALDEVETKAFERHLVTCARCLEDVDRLRAAADALPRSVTPLAPPPTLKRSLMEVVQREAREAAGRPRRASVRELFTVLLPGGLRVRPGLALGVAAMVLAVGIAAGFGVARIAGGGEARTVSASVDHRRVPFASARLVMPDRGRDGGILRLHGLPNLPSNRVYQVWVQEDHEIIPGPVFGVRQDGSGAAAVPEELDGADAVMVTREPRGGARAPSEKPILRVNL
jgi:anti-sigma-K factor RskA